MRYSEFVVLLHFFFENSNKSESVSNVNLCFQTTMDGVCSMFELVNPHLLPVHVLIRNLENKITKEGREFQ